MKRFFFSGIIAVLVLSMFVSGFPVMAQGVGYTKVQSEFNLANDSGGTKLPHGSLVRFLNDATTEVYGPDGSLILKARDSDAAIIHGQNGDLKATHSFALPNG